MIRARWKCTVPSAYVVSDTSSCVARKRGGWGYSLALLVAMVVTVVTGFWQYYSGWEGMKSFFWGFIFQGLYNNLGSAMFSLLAFYIATAAYRAFRLQNIETGLMMGSSIEKARVVITSNLRAGERLIVVGHRQVEDGQRVKPGPAPEALQKVIE